MHHIVLTSQTSHDRTPSSLTYPPPPIQPKFILCCPCAHWNTVRFLVASPVREDESFSVCLWDRSHQLRRACSVGSRAGPLLTQRYYHGFRWQLQLWASAWVSVVTQAADINVALGYIRTTDTSMALSGYMDHKPRCGLRWLHMPLASAWLTEVAEPEDITKALGSDTDCVRPGAAAWTTDTYMASHGIPDHGGPLRRPNPESQTFLVSGLLRCPEPGESCSWVVG